MSVDSKVRNKFITKPKPGNRFYPVLENRVGDLHGLTWHKIAAVTKGYDDGSWMIRCFNGGIYVTMWSNKHLAWVFAT
jgi:hypothetical protein